ncbi:MAG TPA: SDR family NAD(P)-dependent oxidoreductase [Terriglobales bacterium]|nr:SDR family NAD(P)-dependent oxidoreductase [Terriglobales bacterium]
MNRELFVQKYGPWAVVTGASDGIGRAFAEQLAALGMNVVLVARRGDRLQQLATEIRLRYQVEARVIAADLSAAMGRATVEEGTTGLDVGLLVAAAGFGTSGPVISANLDVERNMLDINCFAVLEQSVAFGQRFVKRGRGGIILMASLLGWQGVSGAAHYAATKAYVQSLAEGLHRELASSNVDVLASAPGPVNSGFAGRADMRMGKADAPATVARASLQALGTKATVIPGALGKFLSYSLLSLPRFLRVRILTGVIASMTQHQSAYSSQ